MEENIIKIVSQTLGVSEHDIKPEDYLVDLAPDSIKLFELLIALEDFFELQVDYRDVVSIETVGQLIEYAKKLKQ